MLAPSLIKDLNGLTPLDSTLLVKPPFVIPRLLISISISISIFHISSHVRVTLYGWMDGVYDIPWGLELRKVCCMYVCVVDGIGWDWDWGYVHWCV